MLNNIVFRCLVTFDMLWSLEIYLQKFFLNSFQFLNYFNSPGGSTNSLDVLSPLVKSFLKIKKRKKKAFLNELLYAKSLNQEHMLMLLSTNLLKQPRKTSLDLVNKLLSLLLEQIFTPAIHKFKIQEYKPPSEYLV